MILKKIKAKERTGNETVGYIFPKAILSSDEFNELKEKYKVEYFFEWENSNYQNQVMRSYKPQDIIVVDRDIKYKDVEKILNTVCIILEENNGELNKI